MQPGNLGSGSRSSTQRRILKKSRESLAILFSGGAGGKWTVVDGFALPAAQPGGDRGARIFVLQVQLDQWSEAETETIGVGLGKLAPKELVEYEAGFEVGAGGDEFDVMDAVAEVEALTVFGGWAQ